MSDDDDGLLIAAAEGNLAAVKRLTATGASLDHVDNAGRSVAHAAAENGHLPVLKFLASKDADLSRGTADRGFNVVHLASRGGHVAVLEWLNGNVPDVRTLYFQRDAKGKIPADSAANGEVKRFFRRVGADHGEPPMAKSHGGDGGGRLKGQQGGGAKGGRQKHGKARAGGGAAPDEGPADEGREEAGVKGGEGPFKPQVCRVRTSLETAIALWCAESLVACCMWAGRGRERDPRSLFRKETDEEVQRGRVDALRPLRYARPTSQENSGSIECPAIIADPQGGGHLPMPQRPAWHRGMSPQELQQREEQAFEQWMERIYEAYEPQELNHFEHSLEVWRQLWRVVEKSHILLVLLDSRCPGLHMHRALYEYIAAAHKGVVLVLTKADLVSPQQLQAWTLYLQRAYSDVVVVPFVSGVSRCAVIEDGQAHVDALLAAIQTRLHTLPTQAWAQEEEAEEGGDEAAGPGCVSVGVVGDPSMGKSSLLNTWLRRKHLSVSATPGHTKHWQTHLVPHCTLRVNGQACGVRVVDCPGVVLPRLGVPRALQVLAGSYPIAQVREPLAVLRYLAEHCTPPLHIHYKLKRPRHSDAMGEAQGEASGVQGEEEGEGEWCPYLLAEAYARQAGFFTKGRGGRADVARAANHMLREALVGRGPSLVFHPPGMRHVAHLSEGDAAVGGREEQAET